MKLYSLLAAGMCAAAMMCGAVFHASAAQERTLFYGDVNTDGDVGVTDIILLQKHLLGMKALGGETAAVCADINRDNAVDVYDLALLKRYVLNGIAVPVNEEESPAEPPATEPPATEPPATEPPSTEPPTTEPPATEPPATEPPTTEPPTTEPPTTEPPTTEPPTTEPPTTEPPTTEPVIPDASFINAPIYDLYGSLPSQGEGRMVVFVVDFPDCAFAAEPDLNVIDSAVFGTQASDAVFNPFYSIHDYYARASKGTMELSGAVYRYTAKYDKAYYETKIVEGETVEDPSKVVLVREIFDAFEDTLNYKDFDADGDRVIDAALITVPNAAGDDNWWPCAGLYADLSYRADRRSVGHVIIGNREILTEEERRSFVGGYAHETGHCMGLPDYYLNYSEDFIGFHGTAGVDLMDVDACSDHDCFSKLMLGWYRQDEVQVYDQSVGGAQTFLLTNAQSDAGNCLILPCGELADGYFSEYMILEYITEEGNNSVINTVYGYEPALVEPGVRVFHVKADLTDNGWWKFFTYENGAEATNKDDDGIRLIRLANDAEGGAPFNAGDVIDGSISGFHWYDAGEGETVDTGYSVSIGSLENGSYTVTVTAG